MFQIKLQQVPADTVPETDEEMIERQLKYAHDAFVRAREDYFERVCPAEYRSFDRSLCEDVSAHDKVVSEISKLRSCIVVGKVGAGKTFAVWQGIKVLIMRGVNPLVCGAVSFNVRASEALKNVEDFRDWLDYVLSCKSLIIDDWAKEPMTDAQERAFFEIVEKRTANGLQVVLVTNRTAAEILEQARKANKNCSRMPDIMRRLSQRFSVVRFGTLQKSTEKAPQGT